MTRRHSRTRRTGPTVEQLVERLDRFGREDAGYRRLTLAVRRALRFLLPLLDRRALARYLSVEQAANARDVYCADAVAQWAYSLGYRDGAMPMPRIRVRKRAVKRLTRLRKARPV
jgi:hypothetical protein